MPEHSTITTSTAPVAQPAAGREILPVTEAVGGDMYAECLQRLPLQRKLAVGATDDPMEREADHIADRVMRMPETSFIQRKCAHCEEEEKAQRKPLASFIQKKGEEAAAEASDAVSSRIGTTRGGGGTLPDTTRQFMESRMETDLSAVRIHTGDYAAELSQQLNAQAFTVGNDIYFNSGKFSPGSDDGKRLLAHELVHTVQQGTGISMKVQRAPLRPPLRPACPVRPDDFIRLVVVNQETPQSVSIFWNSSGKVETGECSTGKGPCCVPDGAPDNAVGATEAQSKINGSNSTEIGTFTVTQVRESNGGINFWTQFLDGRSEALHEYTPVDGTPLSHGCVRLHTEMAKKIHCGAIANVTRVEVRGFARPRCSHPALIAEWLSDFRNASPRDDGDKDTVELRHELIHHFNLGQGEAGQKALDDKIGSLQKSDPDNPGRQFIDPVKGAAVIPRCTGVSGLGKEVERLQRTRPDQHNDAAATAFRNSLGLATSVAAATTAARQSGTDLWKNAHGPAASVDDRPLYWTRNFIIRELQEWHPLFSVSPAQRAGIIKTFERTSRGLDVTAFAPVEAGTKRILITGFDPFGMDDSFGRPGAMSGMSVGNPSGAIVLALDGQTISGSRCSALIQGVVFPVRYRDFDEGVVEQYVRHFTGGANPVDMIMTISRNRDDGIFELERFAGRARSGFPDNEGANSNQAALDRSLARIHGPHARTDEFTQSTLPRANMSAPPRVVMDDSYSGHLPDGKAVDQTTSPVPGANVRSDNGSGGNYLSNEIFYRVSLLQLNQHTRIPMGHLHVPGGTQAEYPAIISTVQQILARALNSTICPPEYNDAPDMPAFRNYT